MRAVTMAPDTLDSVRLFEVTVLDRATEGPKPAAADHDWLQRLVTRRIPLDDWQTAFTPHEGDIKTILTFGSEEGPT